MAAVVVLVLQSLSLFNFKAIHLFFQVVKVNQYTFQVGSFLIQLICNCFFFLKFKFLIDFLEQWRG